MEEVPEGSPGYEKPEFYLFTPRGCGFSTQAGNNWAVSQSPDSECNKFIRSTRFRDLMNIRKPELEKRYP